MYAYHNSLSTLSSIPESAQHPDCPWGPPSLLSSGYGGALFPGIKGQGREADRSPPSNAELKNDGAVTSLPYMSSWHSA
jgi:hypothetical protein